MNEILKHLKDVKICDTMVTIKTRINEESTKRLEELVKEILN